MARIDVAASIGYRHLQPGKRDSAVTVIGGIGLLIGAIALKPQPCAIVPVARLRPRRISIVDARWRHHWKHQFIEPPFSIIASIIVHVQHIIHRGVIGAVHESNEIAPKLLLKFVI